MAIKAKAEISLVRVNDGSDGKPGENGIGIKSTTVTYQASNSQTTVPTGSWSTTIPQLSSEKPYLWTKTVLTYTDGKSTASYSVSSTMDGVSVGARNYIRNSKTLMFIDYVLSGTEAPPPELSGDDNGGVILSNATLIGEDGNVIIDGAKLTDDGEGNVTITPKEVHYYG